MKIDRRDGSRERTVMIGMITDTSALARIRPIWDADAVKSKWGKLVGKWCCDYFDTYGKAPGRDIESIFESWASKDRDKETTDLVRNFLSVLSDEYALSPAERNSDYLVDVAAEYFNDTKLRAFRDALEGDLDTGDIKGALKRIDGYNRIELGMGAGIDPFRDFAAMEKAFADEQESLIDWPGYLAEFYGHQFQRDAFIAYMGPEKRGKSYCLQDIFFRATLQGLKTVYFEVGDMSQSQVIRRLITRICKRPWRATPPDKPVRFPRHIFKDPDDPQAVVDFTERHFSTDLTLADAKETCRKLVKKTWGENGPCNAKLFCYPNSSINVAGLRSNLDYLERTGWGVPSVICIDYADILAPPAGTADTRDQINTTWKQLRQMSQALHCLVVTATQTDAASYKADIIERQHFSEDKRKLAHCTAMYGLNQTRPEKRDQILRINPVVIREDYFEEEACVHIAQCLAIANPTVLSCP